MATKFTSLEEKKVIKKTKFEEILISRIDIQVTDTNPIDWGNVKHIGYDQKYGDVFKCWDDDEDGFTLYFGEKGDEFN